MSKFDKLYHTWVPMTFYCLDDVLYLPRGISLKTLVRNFNETPVSVPITVSYKEIDKWKMLVEPISSMQKDAIDFLSCKNTFIGNNGKSQFMLNLDTGDGKTVAAITAAINLSYRTIIIVHQKKIKEQWIDTFREKTNVPDDKVLNITTPEIINTIMDGGYEDVDFFLINHQLLAAYARKNSWDDVRRLFIKMRIGLKIIDEAHLFFSNILKIDYFSDVPITFYLTATFGRSDTINEMKLYKTAFSNVVRFGEETFSYDDKRKHINLMIGYYRTNIKYGRPPYVKTKMGFSVYKYIEYELAHEDNAICNALLYVLDQISHMDGKVCIISPKIESAEFFATLIKNSISKDVGTVHSGNTAEENESNLNCKYISSIPKSIGTGVDIKGLRVLINLEPMGVIAMDQLRGRLRIYSKDKDTYLFYLVDSSIPEAVKMVERALPMFKEKCKSIRIMNLRV